MSEMSLEFAEAVYRLELEQKRIADLEAALAEERARLHTARPYDEWHEDIGAVLWCVFPIESPPYCGTPLDSDFPRDRNMEPLYTYWTPLPDYNEIQRRFYAARENLSDICR